MSDTLTRQYPDQTTGLGDLKCWWYISLMRCKDEVRKNIKKLHFKDGFIQKMYFDKRKSNILGQRYATF